MAGLSNGAFTRTNGAAPGEATVYPRFFMDTVQDMIATEQQGRPIFREEERVEIIMAGNAFSRPVHRVTSEHRERWPDQYSAFKKGQEISVDGTPLEEWPILRRAQVMELKAIGFVTVEQIAAMSDQAIQRIPMYGRQLKELAGAFLDDAKAMALVTRATAEAERKEGEMAALRLQVENLGALVQQLHGQLRHAQDAPHALATAVPGLSDPVEIAKAGHAPQAPSQSSFADLPGASKRSRGKQVEAA